MKVTVTALDVHPVAGHPDPYFDRSVEPFVGTHLVVSPDGVWVDGTQVIYRDRRAKKNRMTGHPWLTYSNVGPMGYYGTRREWTGFDIDIQPNYHRATKARRILEETDE